MAVGRFNTAGTLAYAGTTGDTVIAINGLRKSYGKLVAVKRVDLEIARGEVFGILGPNGAGKTTTLEMVEGLRKPDAGSITVNGIDAVRQPQRLKEIIGVQLQSTALFNFLTNFEILQLFASFYARGMRDQEIDDLLKQVNLAEKRNNRVEELSGGQQQRLSIALTLVNKPDVVFLDEPTTGLDPQARHNLWDLVRDINALGKTVVLTTHYMEEAEMLCHRIAIMDHGEVLALDTPSGLIAGLHLPPTISGVTDRPLPRARAQQLPGVQELRLDAGHFELRSTTPQDTLVALMALATELGTQISDLNVRGANLEDVFISLTGRSLRA
jgi:ABC-2 type transport system ATP-binding protein